MPEASYQVLMTVGEMPAGGIAFPGSEYLSRLDRMTPRQVAAAGRKDKIRIGSELTTLEASATAPRGC